MHHAMHTFTTLHLYELHDGVVWMEHLTLPQFGDDQKSGSKTCFFPRSLYCELFSVLDGLVRLACIDSPLFASQKCKSLHYIGTSSSRVMCVVLLGDRGLVSCAILWCPRLCSSLACCASLHEVRLLQGAHAQLTRGSPSAFAIDMTTCRGLLLRGKL
jgi:hypothetical protein